MRKTLFVAAIAAYLLCGCGYRGPLYLPAAKPKAAKPLPPQPESILPPDESRPFPSEAVPVPK